MTGVQTCALPICKFGLVPVAYTPIAKGRVADDAELLRIARRCGRTAAQVSLRWLVQQDISAIPRTSKIERLQENLDIDFQLSDADMAAISAIAGREAGGG